MRERRGEEGGLEGVRMRIGLFVWCERWVCRWFLVFVEWW